MSKRQRSLLAPDEVRVRVVVYIDRPGGGGTRDQVEYEFGVMTEVPLVPLTDDAALLEAATGLRNQAQYLLEKRMGNHA